MNTTIIVAIIGGIFAIASSLLTLILTKWFESKSVFISPDRRETLKGQWEGSAHQEIGPDGVPFDIQLVTRITATSRAIQADAEMHSHYQNQKHIEYLEFTGTLVYDRFVKLEYKPKDKPGLIQFGFLLLELGPNGKSLDGHFLSYGPTSQKFVRGTVQLHKVTM